MLNLKQLGFDPKDAVISNTYTAFKTNDMIVSFTKTYIGLNAALRKAVDTTIYRNITVFKEFIILSKEATETSRKLTRQHKKYSPSVSLKKNANQLVGIAGKNTYYVVKVFKQEEDYVILKVVQKRHQDNHVINVEK